MSDRAVVIVGAGHAGVQAAASLREEGFAEPIALLCDETELPYQRPPLSKAFLKGAMDLHGLPLRAAQFYRDHRIDLRLGEGVSAIDRARKTVTTKRGAIPYGHLILATGARQRRLEAAGVDLAGVLALRNIADALAIRERIAAGVKVVIVGAGFIGLEIAATAAGLGAEATVVEIARPMGRAVSPVMSDFFLAAHQAFGARFRLGRGVTAIRGEAGRANAVELTDGEVLPADLVIVGVGVTAEDGLARASGLDCANGIVVDALMQTSDPAISAIGDCAEFPFAALGRRLRLESVQNAVDQARCVAARLTGKPRTYDALPWFWSDQGDLKLQIAGLSHDVDTWATRGDPATRAFSTFGFRQGRLAVVESVNRGADHMAARRIIGTPKSVTPEQAADLAFDLRKLAMS